jgi:hypothetical protein
MQRICFGLLSWLLEKASVSQEQSAESVVELVVEWVAVMGTLSCLAWTVW